MPWLPASYSQSGQRFRGLRGDPRHVGASLGDQPVLGQASHAPPSPQVPAAASFNSIQLCRKAQEALFATGEAGLAWEATCCVQTACRGRTASRLSASSSLSVMSPLRERTKTGTR